jgi:hypothetical protein
MRRKREVRASTATASLSLDEGRGPPWPASAYGGGREMAREDGVVEGNDDGRSGAARVWGWWRDWGRDMDV